MTNAKEENKVVVKIFGDEYPITGVADSKHICRVADYVDTKMKELARTSRIKSRDKIAILTAMSIASELHEKAELLDDSQSLASGEIDQMIEKLDTALAATV